MKVGISTLLFPTLKLPKAIEVVAASGAEGIEIIYDMPHFMPGSSSNLRQLRRLVRSWGLGVSVHASFWGLNPISHYPQIRRLTLARIKRSIEGCRALGGEVVVIHSGQCPLGELKQELAKAKRDFSRFLQSCLAQAKASGITLAIENLNRPDFPFSTPEEIATLAERFKGLGVAYDIGHAYLAERRRGSPAPERAMVKILRRVGKHVAHVHVHDNHGLSDEHLLPGDGAIDFKPVVRAIQKAGFRGFWVAELWNPRRPVETAKAGVTRLRKMLV